MANSEHKEIAMEDEDKKPMKVSILQQLQSFRFQKTASSSMSSVSSPTTTKKLTATSALSMNQKDDATCYPQPINVNPIITTPEDAGKEMKFQTLKPDDKQVSESIPEESESTVTDVDVNLKAVAENGQSDGDIDTQRKNEIKPIDRGVVHQICSGQVIVTLSTAVKELVENSLDAGATKIDIRLVEYGSKLVEVSDNGCGIAEANFEGLALKHHTSKLGEFKDLESLTTFGFRGEALSSLCALSTLSVSTRHIKSDQKSGYKIDYNNAGRIILKNRCAREYGTTITLKDLFHTLPVRHREFLKNLKREFHRMITVLYGYCLVVNGVRITCTNQLSGGGPTNVVSVPAAQSMKERIVAVFGSKQFTSLIEIKQPDEIPLDILAELGLIDMPYETIYELEGYISQPNLGRSSCDRQFCFINSRPCDYGKIGRAINDAYHTFSRHQYPFVCLHIKTKRENVDVNVTPDKRTLYVQNEKILLATIKAALVPILSKAASTFTSSLSQSQLNFTGQQQIPDINEKEDNSLCNSGSFEISHASNDISATDMDTTLGESSSVGFARQYSTQGSSRLPRSVVDKTEKFLKRFKKDPAVVSSSYKRSREIDTALPPSSAKQPKMAGFLKQYSVCDKQNISEGTSSNEMEVESEANCNEDNIKDKDELSSIHSDRRYSSDCLEKETTDVEILYDDDIESNQDNTSLSLASRKVKIDWNEVKNFNSISQNDAPSSTEGFSRRFRAKISPNDNATAEEELKKQLSKDMFAQMEILGQFNLGFIIVKNGPDLFIVDQHASDEKYNFEDLEKNVVLQGQRLICPLDLQLPAISENIIAENISAFQKNGFDFIISPDEMPTKKVKLTKIPYSKGTEFGKSDVEELVFMMEDAPHDSFYRPTKVRQMLASRACRKSVMIGTALNLKEMRRIVNHMGEMEQPWNCPHGRPTIRHLINLNILPDLDDIKFNH